MNCWLAGRPSAPGTQPRKWSNERFSIVTSTMKSIPELAGSGNAGLGKLYRLPPSGDGTSTIDGAWALPFGTFGPSPPPQPGSARVPAAAATPARKLRRSKPRPLVPLLITIDSLWLADPGVRCTRRFAADWNISTDAVAQS